MTPLQKKVVSGLKRDELLVLLDLFSKASEHGPVPDPSAAVVLAPYSERTRRTGRIPLVYRESEDGKYSLQTLEGEPAASGSVNARYKDRHGLYAWSYTARKIQKRLDLPVPPLRQHTDPGVLRPLRGKGVGAALYMAGSIRALALWARNPEEGASLLDTADVATYSLPEASRCPGADEGRSDAADRFWRSAAARGLVTTLPAETMCVSDTVEAPPDGISPEEARLRFPSTWRDDVYDDWRVEAPDPWDQFVDALGGIWTVEGVHSALYGREGPWITLVRDERVRISEESFAFHMGVSPEAVSLVEHQEDLVFSERVDVLYGGFDADVVYIVPVPEQRYAVTGHYRSPPAIVGEIDEDIDEDIDIMFGLQLLEEGDCLLYMGTLYGEFEEDEPFRWADPLVYRHIDISTVSAAALAYTLAAREKPYIQKALRALKDNEHFRSPEDEEKVARVVKLLGIKPGRKENPDQRAEVRARAAWISGLTVGGDG